MGSDEQSSSLWEHAWTHVAPAQHAWVRRVHDALRASTHPDSGARLVDMVPLAVWSKFEFISQQGASYDVDLLVLTPTGVYLIELFEESAPMVLNEQHWIIQRAQGQEVIDTPLRAARAKAERLHRALDAEMFSAHHAHAPRITPLVLLTHPGAQVTTVVDAAAHHVVGMPGQDAVASVVDALTQGRYPGGGEPHGALTPRVLDRVRAALGLVGIGPSQKAHQITGWTCHRLIETSQSHQDYVASPRGATTRHRLRAFISSQDLSKKRQQELYNSARREFELLETLKHHSILQVERFIDHDRRPALIFEHIDGAARLDLLLKVREDWGTRARLIILRKLSDAILYAHRNHVIHRALSPASVLVHDLQSASGPHLKLYDWQMAFNTRQSTGTAHITDYMEEGAAVYLAPEVCAGYAASEATDVWGLGCIAYTLFTGFAPANDLADLHAKLMRDGGLRPSLQVDGIPKELDDLIVEATHPVARRRVKSVEAFRQRLDQVWSLTIGDSPQEANKDPREANVGDVLDDRWEVVRPLGSGSSAVALLVRDGDREVVLKVARSKEDAIRLEREGRQLEALAEVKQVVGYHGVVQVHDYYALVLDYAGQTLRERLSNRGSAGLGLDELRRVGRELCDALLMLERQNVLHRDIKPANIGMGSERKSTRRLTLFDFSLAGTPIDNLHVGTSAYRDPFLSERDRWDERADHYAGALTLYEMATGSLPVWGTGDAPPALDPDARLHMEPELFDASVRDDLAEFFARALHRDVTARFSSALEMRAAWKAIFAETTSSKTTDDDLAHVTPQTSIRALKSSEAARDALDRLSVTTARDLLALNTQSIYFQRGTSNDVRQELMALRTSLEGRMPPMTFHEATIEGVDDWSKASLEQLVELAIDDDADLLFDIFGLNDPDPDWGVHAVIWPTRADMAAQAGMEVAQFNAIFDRIAQAWADNPCLDDLRQSILAQVEHAGGVLSARDLASLIIQTRSAEAQNLGRRRALGSAAARVAVEAQLLAQGTEELGVWRVHDRAFVYTRKPVAQALGALGQRADELSSGETIRSKKHAEQALQKVFVQQQAGKLATSRLLVLAAQASAHTALSSRDELYPVGLDAERALKLTKGSIANLPEIGLSDLRARVASRYPEAQALPEAQAVDAMMERQRIGLRLISGKGATLFRADKVQAYPSSGRSSMTSINAPDRIDFDARAFDKDLANAHEWGGFRVLLVDPKYLALAQARLRASFDSLRTVDADALWFDAMGQVIDEHPKLTWPRVLSADAPDASTGARRNLSTMMRHKVSPLVREALYAHQGQDILLTQPGLFGRYAGEGSMQLIEDLSDAANTPQGPRLFWLLLPADRQSNEPRIGDVAVPRTSPSQITRLPGRWLRA